MAGKRGTSSVKLQKKGLTLDSIVKMEGIRIRRDIPEQVEGRGRTKSEPVAVTKR